MSNLKNPSNRFGFIDTLRVVAALWVFLFHVSDQITLFFGNLPGISFFLSKGYFGVDLFFGLSGFLAAYQNRNTAWNFPTYKQFLVQRLIRLYPLHLAILLALLVMILAAPFIGIHINNLEDYGVSNFIAHLFLLSAWSFPAQMSWNYFAWAISALWLAILLTPLFLMVIKRISSKLVLTTLLLLMTCITPLIMHAYPYESFVAYAIPRALAGYSIGMGLYFLFKGKTFEFPSHPYIEYAAYISYAFYMVQYPVLMLFKKVMPLASLASQGTSVQILYLAGEFALCTSAALFAYHVIEKPAKKYFTERYKE